MTLSVGLVVKAMSSSSTDFAGSGQVLGSFCNQAGPFSHSLSSSCDTVIPLVPMSAGFIVPRHMLPFVYSGLIQYFSNSLGHEHLLPFIRWVQPLENRHRVCPVRHCLDLVVVVFCDQLPVSPSKVLLAVPTSELSAASLALFCTSQWQMTIPLHLHLLLEGKPLYTLIPERHLRKHADFFL